MSKTDLSSYQADLIADTKSYYDDLVANAIMNYAGISKVEYYHRKLAVEAKRDFDRLKKQAINDLKLMQQEQYL